MDMTRRVSIRDAKAGLSHLMKDVAEGAEIIVMNRGKAVARIVPFRDERPALTEWVAAMEREGVVEKLMAKKPRGLPPPLPVPEGAAQRLLEEDRAI
jgi:prevent-host-death family protein